ncbi:hypothetical protein TNCV_4598851 [Trichonephila clavipes]|nr:hypothetical protein TNCV_4598851 [Trichonephila clavipes]
MRIALSRYWFPEVLQQHYSLNGPRSSPSDYLERYIANVRLLDPPRSLNKINPPGLLFRLGTCPCRKRFEGGSAKNSKLKLQQTYHYLGNHVCVVFERKVKEWAVQWPDKRDDGIA